MEGKPVFRARSQLMWYILGGLLLILAGIFALFEIVVPYAWSVALMIFGLVIIVASLMGHRPNLSALALLLIGLVAFGVVSSGYTTTVPSRIIKSYELTTNQVHVEKLNITCTVTTGNINLFFIPNRTLIYSITFTQQSFPPTLTPEVRFANATSDEKLIVDASTTTANVEIIISENIQSSFQLVTTTGNIVANIQSAKEIVEMTMKATTGNVEAYLSDPTRLKALEASTTTGNVKLSIGGTPPRNDCKIQLSTTTGSIRFDLLMSANVGCDLKASTTFGRISTDLQGFTVLDETDRSVHIQTQNYEQAPNKLVVVATTNFGNCDIIATVGNT